MRPPVRTWDLMTVGAPRSSAIRLASAGVVANPWPTPESRLSRRSVGFRTRRTSCGAQPTQAPLQRVELRGHLDGQAVAEFCEELADGRDLLLPLLGVDGEDLLELVLGHVEPLGV